MPPPLSAGILLYRRGAGETEVLLIHPGGPYWTNKDAGAWMIPKGGVDDGESAQDAAAREFAEETGFPLAAKLVEVFAAEGDFDTDNLSSADFEMEWPPRSGALRRFPEADKARWMTLAEARRMMLESQLPMLDALEAKLQSMR